MTPEPSTPLDLLAAPVAEGRLQHNLRGVRARAERRRVRRAQLRASAVTAALLLIAGASAYLLGRPDAQQALLERTPAPRHGAARPLAPDVSTRVLTLRDGSRVFLGEGARLSLAESTDARIRPQLHAGWARFEVVPGLKRVFEVDAGPLQVVVVGTSFTLARSGEHARVAVHHGRVQVASAGSPDEAVTLTDGQHLERAPAAPAELGDARAPIPSPAARAAMPVHDALERADMLRQERRWRPAAAVLRAALASHPDDADVGSLLLTLAELELDALHDPRAAAGHFTRAAACSLLPAMLREQAQARAVEAWLAAGERVSAATAAVAYTAAHPAGRYLSLVKRALGDLPPP